MLWLLRIGSIFYSFAIIVIFLSILNGEEVFQLYQVFGTFIFVVPQLYFAWFYKFN